MWRRRTDTITVPGCRSTVYTPRDGQTAIISEQIALRYAKDVHNLKPCLAGDDGRLEKGVLSDLRPRARHVVRPCRDALTERQTLISINIKLSF